MTYLAAFDWNGTLFNDTAATLIASNVCLQSFGKQPLDLLTMQENFTFPLIHFYERMGVSADEYLERAEEKGDLFLQTYEDAAKQCAVMDGAIDLLQWLNDRNVHCMILSNHLQPKLEEDVARLGIMPFMKTLSGNTERATITQGLSKQMRLDEYMKEHGFTADKTFIIGDSHEEPQVAKHLGLLGISISGGLLSPARLEKYKADYIIHKLHEVRPILEKHWKL